MLPINSRRLLRTTAAMYCAWVWLSLCATPNSGRAGEPTDPPRPCVLLTNDNVLYGDAKQLGEWVVVRNGDGNESRLPRQNVACWAGSIRDLYRYRVDRRRPGNLQDLINDARWCLDYDLLEEARSLAREIRLIDPENALIRLLEKRIEHRISPHTTSNETIPSIQTASHMEDDESFESESLSVGIVELKMFAGQVQPLLVNRCGGCHSDPSAREWSLTLPAHGVRPSSRMTRENLQRSLAFLDASSPEQSPLLRKAMSPHGGVDAPLEPSDVRAVEVLQYWIRRTTTKISGEQQPMIDSRTSSQPPTQPVLDSSLDSTSTVTAESLDAISFQTSPVGLPSNGSKVPQVARLPKVANPFDPEIFNRKFHSPGPSIDPR